MIARISTATHSNPTPDLSEFNSQVLQLQDEVFTLAWYMSGDEGQAIRIAQAAFEQAYRQFNKPGAGLRQHVLRQVSLACLGRPSKEAGLESGSQELQRYFLRLPAEQRLSLILVDVLGLGYQETATVLRWPVRRVTNLLARGRVKLSLSMRGS